MKTIESGRIDRGWALLFARLVLGLIFFMAGVWKVFGLGPLEHARKFFLPFADAFLPVWSLWLPAKLSAHQLGFSHSSIYNRIEIRIE